MSLLTLHMFPFLGLVDAIAAFRNADNTDCSYGISKHPSKTEQGESTKKENLQNCRDFYFHFPGAPVVLLHITEENLEQHDFVLIRKCYFKKCLLS